MWSNTGRGIAGLPFGPGGYETCICTTQNGLVSIRGGRQNDTFNVDTFTWITSTTYCFWSIYFIKAMSHHFISLGSTCAKVYVWMYRYTWQRALKGYNTMGCISLQVGQTPTLYPFFRSTKTSQKAQSYANLQWNIKSNAPVAIDDYCCLLWN